MLKLIIIYFLNLFLYINCTGQITFSKMFYHFEAAYTWGNSVIQDSGYYYIFGNGSTEFLGAGHNSTFFLKTDSFGNEIASVNFAEINTAWIPGNPGSLKKIKNGFIASGIKISYDTLFPINEKGTGHLYFFNTDCDTLFSKQYVGDGYTAFYNTDIVNDTIFLFGATRDTLNYQTYMYLVTADTLGNILSEKRYGTGIIDEIGLNIDHFENGNLVLSGGIEYDGTGSLTDDKIYKTGSDGNPYFSETYGTPYDDGPFYAKPSINNLSLVVEQSIDTLINEGDHNYARFIGKMDTSGNYIWRTFFNRSVFLNFWNFRPNIDGSIIACGTTKPDSLENLHGFITKLDSNGIILWERTYTTDNYYDAYFFDVQQTTDKGFIISGSAVGDILGEPNQQMWLVKLDSMGCLEPGCADTFTYIKPILIQNAIFNIFPNPVTNTSTVEIKIPEGFQIISGKKLILNIYDITGKLVDNYSNIQIHNSNEVIRFNIYKKNLVSGIYEAALFYGGMKLGVIKLQYSN